MAATLRRCADLPAPFALALFYACGAGIVAGDLRATPLPIVVIVAWGLYCIGRQTVGWGLFALPLGQSILAQISDWITDGAYWYVYVGLIPFGLYAAYADDRAG